MHFIQEISLFSSRWPHEIQTVRNYLVLCRENPLYHADWMLCPCIFNGKCRLGRVMFPIDTKKGGINRFGVHTQTNEKSTVPTEAVQELDVQSRDEILRADALAAMFDLRPKSFAEAHKGIALFAESIFKTVQTIPYGVTINRKSHLPTKTAIDPSIEKMVHDWRISFRKCLKNHF